MAGNEIEVDFQDLAKGRMSNAPIRSLASPGGQIIWRDSLNFSPRDGLMRRRPAIFSLSGGAELPPSKYRLTPLTSGQRPVFVYSSTSALHSNFTAATGGLNGTTAYRVYNGSASVETVVTNRQIFIANDATSGLFVDATPQYTTGTVSVTNGSAVVVGVGTAWATRSISPFQHIKIASVWYQISVVTDDTHMTLSQNYAGSTAGGLAYVISRTFGMGNSNGADKSSEVHCTVYNRALYCCGTFLGRADGIPTPTVIKVSEIFSASPVTTYLTSSAALVSGLDTIAATDMSGILVLQDSRVVVSADGAVVYYSSNLSDAVWSTTPGGFTVVEHKSGSIMTIGWLSSRVTVHFTDGIVWGYPTGQSDPPLNFVDSDATEGCIAPHTLKEWQGKQYFIGFDANVYVFDGNTTSAIGDDVKNGILFAGRTIELIRNTAFAGFNHKYAEYTIYFFPTDLINTFAFCFHYGSWFPYQYPAPIGAVTEFDSASSARYYALAGMYSLDGSTEKNMVCGLSSDLGTSQDQVLYSGSSVGEFSLTTDDIDFGFGLTYKSILAVVCWFRGEILFSTDSITVYASRDGGSSWISGGAQTPLAASSGETPVSYAFLDAINAALAVRFKIAANTSNAFSTIPTRLIVSAIPIGDAGLVAL